MGKNLLPVLALGGLALATGGLGAAPATAATTGAGGVTGAAGAAADAAATGMTGLTAAETANGGIMGADLVANAATGGALNPEYFGAMGIGGADSAMPIFTGSKSLPFMDKVGNVANQFSGGGLLGGNTDKLRMMNMGRGMLGQQPQQRPVGGGGGRSTVQPAQPSQTYSPPYVQQGYAVDPMQEFLLRRARGY